MSEFPSNRSILCDKELETNGCTQAVASSSQPDSTSNNYQHDDYVLKLADSLPEIPSEQSPDTRTDSPSLYSDDINSDEYEDQHSGDEWPTLAIPYRKIYTIPEEDRDYDTEEDLPEIYVPNPFKEVHSPRTGYYEDEFDDVNAINEHSSSRLEEGGSDAGENNPEQEFDDDSAEILRRILQVLQEHSIDPIEGLNTLVPQNCTN